MRAFLIIWIGQFVSLLGTTMTRFALTIWAWQITGEATALALVGFFAFAPEVLISPLAGALVDRMNRRLVMMLSDLAAGLATIAILLLYLTGRLEIWHLYLAGAFAGVFQSFQFPAYSAAISLMVPREQYVRANGLIGLAGSASQIAAPALAALLLGVTDLSTLLLIDIATFLVAIGCLLVVLVPQPAETEAGRAGRGSLWQESLYGFRYILQRPSLLGLQLVFFSINLTATLSMTLMAPMILARSGDSELALGAVQSALGIGGVAGGLLISAWGGPKRRVHGVLLGMAASSLLGEMALGLGRGVVLWSVGAFFATFFIPLINGANQAIWQAKVPPDVQGRVFAIRRLIAQITAPLAMLIAGPLADRVFEPAMLPGGALAVLFGGLVGMGRGAGMGLLFLLTGVLGILIGLAGYLFPAVRDAEDILPDHEGEIMQPAARPAGT
ncbi:MAG: MFS transporter [Anaerolineae bacterium]